MNRTDLSFLPSSTVFDFSNSPLSWPAALSRIRGACSVSRMTILRRINWSGVYGTPTGGGAGVGAPPRLRCGDGEEGVWGEVFALGLVVYCA